MIKLNGVEITAEQFKEIAAREGYVKEFEYPIYMQDVEHKFVVKFAGLQTGEVIVSSEGGRELGDKSNTFIPHTITERWKPWQPHEELKKQYAEDAKTASEPWMLWEFKTRSTGWEGCFTIPEWDIERQYRRKETKPKTYDGLTEDQWNQVKDEELLCEFWDDETRSHNCVTELLGFNGDDFISRHGTPYCCTFGHKIHCRIHRAFPQFVIDGKKPDWLDDANIVAVRYPCYAELDGVDAVRWNEALRFQVVGL